ncbi:Kip2 protein [Saccharomycopsis crataegensis]|uniref:Kinesin-like protein n=1 Tax=Saccharomycopsis crataegensis TaxID=43959 RepID=A0AAV5QTQ2_9ASCO|nr:Kip2 protein [Saccharomycopsis crataegensis]
MSNFTVPRLSPNKRQSYRPPSRQNGSSAISTGGSLRRPASTMSLRSTSSGIRRPSTPVSSLRNTSGSMISSRASSPNSSRPSSSLSSRSTRPVSSMSGLSSRSSTFNENIYSGTIMVSVRPRPLREQVKTSWMIDSDESTIYSPELGDFTFDSVFGNEVNNQDVYNTSVADIVNKTLDGFNGTVFAYGITGSGKTHSMQGSPSDPGIIPLAVTEIFNFINENSHIKNYSVKVSYLEIYNEKILDLLQPENSSTPQAFSSASNPSTNDLKIRDDPMTGVKVVGLSEEPVNSVDELLSVIERGHMSRKTGETEFNSRSSRSHAIVLIRICSIDILTKAETVSTLSLCDLAGSERAATQTARRKEGAYINKSLLALSTAIAKLSAASTSKTNSNVGHIPFRDSKLTRLLQPSLSGNSVISILCTVHLGEQSYSETVSTLRFAAKAKNITLNASKHELLGGSNSEKDRVIEKLQNAIQKQKVEIELLKASNGLNSLSISSLGPLSESSSSSSDSLRLRDVNAQLASENRLLTERVEHLSRLMDEKRTENVILKTDIMTSLTSVGTLLNNPTVLRNLEELFRDQATEIEEYNSYISHLENELGKYEYKKYFGESQNQPDSSPAVVAVVVNDENIECPLSPISDSDMNGGYKTHGLVSPSKVRNNVLKNGNQRELQSLIETQKEEIDDLKESIKNKDKIIKALRTSSRFKNSLSTDLQ